MIRTTDAILFASRNGLGLSPTITKEALQSVDREALEAEATKHWTIVLWDGTGDPPVGKRDQWVHDADAHGIATQAAFTAGKVVYFLLRDGKLHHYQPYVAYERGRIALETDTNHPYHWKKAGQAHIAREVESEVDQQVLHAALEQALILHEQRGVPVGIAPVAKEG